MKSISSMLSAILVVLCLTAVASAAPATRLGFGPAPGDKDFTAGFYVTVEPGGDTPENRTVVREITETITADGYIRVPVRWGDPSAASVAQAKSSRRYKYHIAYIQRPDGMIALNFEKWIKDYETDPERVGWVIGRVTPKARVQSLLRRVLSAEKDLKLTYEGALAFGLSQSNKLKLVKGEYALIKNDQVISFDEAFSIYLTEAPKQRHWMRMIAESTLLFGGQLAKYYSDYDFNSLDFDYEADWKNVRERFITLKAWKLDDNLYNTNAWRHPGQGALNYIFARSNGFSPLEAYLIGITLSSLWEFFGEYRETVSINDMIVTPAAGYVIGEAFSQFGAFFLRGKNNWANFILGNVFSGGKGLMDWVDGNRPKHSQRLSTLGFDETVWHRFKAYIVSGDQSSSTSTQGMTRMGFESEIITIPDFEKPGSVDKFLTGGAFSRLSVQSTWGNNGHHLDGRFFAYATMLAVYKKRISKDNDGYNLMYGIGSAYQFGIHNSERRDAPLTSDKVAIVHIAGPTVDLTIYHKGLRVRMVLDVFGDFAMLRNYSIDKQRSQDPMTEIKATIARENYYHALGVTGSGRLVANYGNLETGINFTQDILTSIDGLDRYQKELKDDYSLDDSRREGRVWIGYGIKLKRDIVLKLELSHEIRRREGQAKNTRSVEEEQRTLGGFAIEF